MCSETKLRKLSSRPYNRNRAYMGFNSKIDAKINRGNRKHLLIFQKTPEVPTWIAQSKGTTENSHVGLCTNTSRSTNAKVQNIQHGK
jgi:hypothetical protein